LSEIGGPGAWTNVYQGKHDAQFALPTVEGVDFPNLGICEARNEVGDGTLHVSTYAATTARRGQATRWKVTQLPDSKAVQVYCDDEPYRDWGIIDEHTIEISSTIAARNFRILGASAGKTANGQQGEQEASAAGEASGRRAAQTATHYQPAPPPS